jgi:hypothetical protein
VERAEGLYRTSTTSAAAAHAAARGQLGPRALQYPDPTCACHRGKCKTWPTGSGRGGRAGGLHSCGGTRMLQHDCRQRHMYTPGPSVSPCSAMGMPPGLQPVVMWCCSRGGALTGHGTQCCHQLCPRPAAGPGDAHTQLQAHPQPGQSGEVVILSLLCLVHRDWCKCGAPGFFVSKFRFIRILRYCAILRNIASVDAVDTIFEQYRYSINQNSQSLQLTRGPRGGRTTYYYILPECRRRHSQPTANCRVSTSSQLSQQSCQADTGRSAARPGPEASAGTVTGSESLAGWNSTSGNLSEWWYRCWWCCTAHSRSISAARLRGLSPTKYIRHGTSKNLNANLDLRLQVSRRDNAAQERELEALRIRRAERQRVAAVATRKLA